MTSRASPDQLNELSRDELVALIVQLIAENEALRAEVERLKQPPTSSRNSSHAHSGENDQSFRLMAITHSGRWRSRWLEAG